MSYAIDDAEFIRRRLEEIEAEKQLALTGSSAPAEQKIGDYSQGYQITYNIEDVYG